MDHRVFQRFVKRIASIFLVPVFLGYAVLSALFVLPVQAASAPNITSYQGRLLNANGVPIATATASVLFEFYDALSAGTCLWSNSSATCASATARTVTLTDGLFSENLGDTAAGVPYAAIADTVFGSNAGVYLQVTVNGEALTPRKQIVAAPYALNADTLDGLDSTALTLLTDGGASTYLTSTTDGLVIGGTTPPAGTLYFNTAAAELNIGTDSTTNGLLRFFSSGGAITDPTIATNITGDLIFTVDGQISFSNSLVTPGNLALNGGVITSTAGTFNFLQGAGNSPIINIGGVAADIGNTISIATEGSTADAIAIGNTGAGTTFQLGGGASWNISTAGLITSASDLALNGGDLTSSSATFNFLDAVASSATINIGGVSTDLANTINIATNGTSGDTVSIGSESAGSTINLESGIISINDNLVIGTTTNIGTGAAFPDAVDIGNTNAATTLVLTGGNDWSIDATGAATFNAGTFGSDVNMNFVTGGAGTENLAIASTHSVDSALNVIDLTFTDDAAASTAYNTLMTLSNANDGGPLALTGTPDAMIALSNLDSNEMMDDGIILTGVAGFTDAIDASDSTIVNAMNVGANVILGTGAAIDFSNFDVATSGGITVAAAQGLDTNGAGALAIGNVNATSVSLCGSVACDTIDIANSSDADTINIATDNTAGDNITIGNNNGVTFVSTYGSGVVVAGYTSLDLNNVSGGHTTNIGGSGAVDGADVINIATNGTTADVITIGNANATSTLAITGGIEWGVTSAGVVSVGLDNLATTNGLCHSGANVDAATNVTRDVVACSAAPADYAEWYETDGTPGNGDIVALTGSMFTYQAQESNAFTGEILPGTVTKTLPILTRAVSADTLFGIVSTSPNETIGANVKDQGAHPLPIALDGRVPLHVTSENGPIAMGDYLTASSTPGYAMKATEPGRVIARALANFNGVGMTTITVFVDNSWYGGDVIAPDGSPMFAGGITISALAVATAGAPVANSNSLVMHGSAWNGSSAETVSMGLRTKVSSLGDYRLSIEDGTGGEVAAFSNAGDLFVAGKLFPSDRGSAQSTAYIFYDSTAGPGYMKTNAAGWNVGSYDFAEMFPSGDALVAGDVVVFGGAEQSVAKSSSTAYDKSVAGVVSTRPGFLAGDYVNGSYPIALSGRVPTNVSAENGAVAIGDPLTTSSKAGYAMKATKAGPILGYAMEPLPSGEGKIVVFIRASYYAGTGGNSAPDANLAISQLPMNSLSNLDVTGSLNMNGGSMLSVGSLEGIGNTWQINQNGDIVTNGVITERVLSYQNELVDTLAVTSRQKTIELSGTSTLMMGQSEVVFDTIDPKFNDVISNTASYRVVVTPAGITGQIYVTDKSNGGFMIHDSANTDGVAVDWLVIAYQKDFEPVAISPIVSAPAPDPLLDTSPVATDVIADNGTSVATDPMITPLDTLTPATGTVTPTPTDTNVPVDSVTAPAPEVAGATDTSAIASTVDPVTTDVPLVDASATTDPASVILDPLGVGATSITPTAP
ncbi:MAG: hypothetical protein WC802_02425 [Patescibacteria group bacterium]|jgi:hypothetical protein